MALVSGSFRRSQTFAIIWEMLLGYSIDIQKVDVRKEFYSTPEDDAGWKELFTDKLEQYQADCAALGETEAILKHMRSAVQARADCVLNALPEGTDSVLIVTHGPYDVLIAEGMFKEEDRPPPLEKGDFYIIRSPA